RRVLFRSDGLATASVTSSMWAMPVIEHLGIRPSFIDSTMIGGSSFVAHLMPALQALASGQCNAVLVCYGSTQRTATLNRAEIGNARRKRSEEDTSELQSRENHVCRLLLE